MGMSSGYSVRTGLLPAVAAACDGTHLLLPLDNDPNARDFDAFLPMQRAFERLCTAARRAGTRVERISIEEAQDALLRGMTWDAVTVSLEGAVAALNELTGERVSDAVVDRVFEKFCVGK